MIDAAALYHLVRSDVALDAKAIADNSSVATWLNTGKAHANNDGTDWRVRTGKSLLPLPSVYLNFYSRVVRPDIRLRTGASSMPSRSPCFHPLTSFRASSLVRLRFRPPPRACRRCMLPSTSPTAPGHSHRRHHHHGGHEHDGKNVIEAWHHESNGTFDGVPAETFFAPTNLAWSRLPFAFRAYLFSPWGYHLLQKIFMLHSLPSDIVYADFIHHVKHSGKAAPQVVQTTVEGYHANKTSHTFDTVLPAINGKKGEFETLDVDVYRYYLLPGEKGPLQTRMVVQNVSVIIQDVPAANGVIHLVDKFIRPKGHPEKGIWAEVAAAAEQSGFGTLIFTQRLRQICGKRHGLALGT